MMILASLLATTSLITLTRASPMSYATYRRRELPVDEHPELLLLYDQRDLENKDSSPRSAYDVERTYGNNVATRTEISEIPNEPEVTRVTRDKKVGIGRNSLSIVNPVDVLRQRVMLELVRRKAIHDLRQMDENRRILETIGKRSVKFDSVYPRSSIRESENNENDNHVYTNERSGNEKHEKHQTYGQKIPAELRTQEWYDVDNTVMRENDDNETRKILSSYHQDRM